MRIISGVEGSLSASRYDWHRREFSRYCPGGCQSPFGVYRTAPTAHEVSFHSPRDSPGWQIGTPHGAWAWRNRVFSATG